MASTYVNDLRLNELATGDASGTWGDITNTNLELIGEALSFGTEAITTNADTHTTTVADGASDPGRAMYLKYTGTLDSACTITIAPNTISRMQFIENGTSGSQNIIISQGSGANITIPPGDTKAVYLDGAGSGAAVVDAFASLNVVDLKVEDDLTITDDLIVNGDIDLEGSIDVNGTANLDVVDIDGALTQDGGAVFNEDSADVDFRVESNGNTHMLFVDAGDNHINIGTATDAGGILNISGSSDGDMTALTLANTVTGGTNDTVALELQLAGTSGQVPASTLRAGKGEDWTSGTSRSGFLAIEAVLDGTNRQMAYFGSDGDGSSKVSFSTNSSERMRINSSGNVGIGETNPGATLHVEHSSGTAYNGGAEILESIIVSNKAGTDDSGVNNVASIGLHVADGATSQGFINYVRTGNNTGNFTFTQRTGGSTYAEAMRIDSSGRVGINRTPAVSNSKLEVGGADNVPLINVEASGATAGFGIGSGNLSFFNGTSAVGTIALSTGTLQMTAGAVSSPTYSFVGDTSTGMSRPTGSTINFVAGGSEVMRVASQVHIGITSAFDGNYKLGLNATAAVAGIGFQNNATTGTMQPVTFRANNNSEIGSIKTSNSVTAFNTSSDYRLKENVQTLENGLDRVKQLKPVKFDWISDGTSNEGFIAHELQEVFPYAVDGVKDGTSMQGVDYGKITPLLVKAIQEQQTIIDDLKSRITTLEGE